MITLYRICLILSFIIYLSSAQTCDFSDTFCALAWNGANCPNEELNTIEFNGVLYSLRNYEVISFTNLNFDQGEIEGRVAVANTFTAGNLGPATIGSGINQFDLTLPYSLVVGGSATWLNGELYPNAASIADQEDMFVGGAFVGALNLIPRRTGSCVVPGCLDDHFDNSQIFWSFLSNNMANYSANTQFVINGGVIILTCNSPIPTLYFVQITGNQMNQINSYQKENCNSEAMWVFNIVGGGNVFFSSSFPFINEAYTIYNIIGPGRTVTASSEVRGNILNPTGSFSQTSGQIYGSVVAQNILNVVQINRPISCVNPGPNPITSGLGSTTSNIVTTNRVTSGSITSGSVTSSSITSSSVTSASLTSSSITTNPVTSNSITSGSATSSSVTSSSITSSSVTSAGDITSSSVTSGSEVLNSTTGIVTSGLILNITTSQITTSSESNITSGEITSSAITSGDINSTAGITTSSNFNLTSGDFTTSGDINSTSGDINSTSGFSTTGAGMTSGEVTTGCVCPTVTSGIITTGTEEVPQEFCPLTGYEHKCPGLDFILEDSSYSFTDFQVVSFGGVSAITGDIEGRLLAYGQVNFGNGFSVGDKVNTNLNSNGYSSERYIKYSLIAGGLVWGSGELYPNGNTSPNENAFIGGSWNLPEYLDNRVTGNCTGCLDAVFEDGLSCYDELQNSLGSQLDNVKSNVKWSGLMLTCNSKSDPIYYVTVSSSQLNQITYYQLSNCNSNARWIININSPNSSESSDVRFSGDSFPVKYENVIYNIMGSERNIYVNTGVNGAILAPRNILNQTGGVIRGKVIIGEITMMLQINKPVCLPVASAIYDSPLSPSNNDPQNDGDKVTSNSGKLIPFLFYFGIIFQFIFSVSI